ncbi:Uncharacterised protein [Suttonella indologenes]|uniref:Uncharacterized protein n=1 Tax=Suttonella indologenes TaxID=13276 RepID=A0A380MJH4_9GAMM|nr:Uncharacterised protein [Suttonella indologenes]
MGRKDSPIITARFGGGSVSMLALLINKRFILWCETRQSL